MPGSHAIEGLIDPKITRILRLFFRKKKELFHLQKISREAHVPLTTTHSLMKKLVEFELVAFITVGKFKLYRLAENDKAKELEQLLDHGS